MDRYVHLCFLPNQPMQFRAVEDGRITDNVWLRVNRSILDVPGVLFCGKVSNANEATPVPIEEAADLIDYGALYGYLDWRVPELQERRKTAELSEILVPDFISTVYLENLPNG